MKLIIAEKPSLARNITSAIGGHFTRKDGYFEGSDYIVSFAFGHLLVLKDVDDYFQREKTSWKIEELPFVPEKFSFKESGDSGARKQYNILKSLMHRQDVTTVINCGDSDREGQVIVDNIIKASGFNKEVRRMWLPEQTEDTIREELKNMKENGAYSHLYNEGLARTYMDWLFGINLTRLISCKSGNLYPVGRVLIPIVKFIYDRDMEIANFEPSTYFIAEANEKIDGCNVKLSLKEPRFNLDEKEQGEKLVERLNKADVVVKSVQKREAKKSPKKLFSLSTAQIHIGKLYKIEPNEVLKCVQSLYEKGFVTYPRTDTEYLAEEEKGKVKKVIAGFVSPGNDIKFKDTKKIFDSKKVESHSAITPTTKIPKEGSLHGNEAKVYETIKNRFLANFCSEECLVDRTTIKITADEFEFTLKGETLKQKGYLKFEPEKEKNNMLPKLEKGQVLDVTFKLEEKETSPPKPVTYEQLANYLKNPFKKEGATTDDEDYKAMLAGISIGTEATRTNIIDNAIKYKYIAKSKSSYSIKDKGKKLIENIDKLHINLYAEKTIEFSKKLKQINKGSASIEESIKLVSEELDSIVDGSEGVDIRGIHPSKEILGECPKCGKEVLESSKNFFCVGYKEGCTFSLWKNDRFFESRGKTITKARAKKFLKDGKISIKGMKNPSGEGTYDGTIVMDVGEKYVNFRNEGDSVGTRDAQASATVSGEEVGKCPACGNSVVETAKGFGCSNWRNGCKYTIWKDDKYIASFGKTVSKEMIELLLKNGKVVYRNLKSRQGKVFSAYFRYELNKETGYYNWKIEFIS